MLKRNVSEFALDLYGWGYKAENSKEIAEDFDIEEDEMICVCADLEEIERARKSEALTELVKIAVSEKEFVKSKNFDLDQISRFYGLSEEQADMFMAITEGLN